MAVEQNNLSWPRSDSTFSIAVPAQRELATIPNNPMVAAVFAAIFKGGPKARVLGNGWAVNDSGNLSYRHLGKRGGEIQVYCNLGRSTGNNDDAINAQIDFVESLNALTADVLIMVLAELCTPGVGNKSKFPLLNPVAISAKTLTKNKNITGWGTQRAAFRDRIVDEISKISRIRCDVIQFPGWDPALGRWNPKGVSITGDAILDISDVSSAPRWGEQTTLSNDKVWLVRAGQWSQWWLNFQGKVWTSPIPNELILFDHRLNRGVDVLAKKIGMNTHFLWGAFRNRQRIDRRIGHLLEDIGELPDSWSRDNHWAGRLRDRFEEALFRLQEKNVIGEIYWHGHYGPGDRDRAKGWVNNWLNAKISVYRPNNKSAPKNAKGKPPGAKTILGHPGVTIGNLQSGPQIRQIRSELYLTQKQLARKLRISPSMLSQIENGRRNVPDRLHVVINKIRTEDNRR